MEAVEHKDKLANMLLLPHINIIPTNRDWARANMLITNRGSGHVMFKPLVEWLGYNIMLQQNEKSAVRAVRRRCVCLYDSQEMEEVQSGRKQHFFEKMPMLSREKSSSIKFKNIEHNNRQPIYEILNDLYENQSCASHIYTLLSTKRINPVIHGGEDRDDLEYFIPQVITFMVIEKNLVDEELINFIIQGCLTDFYFAHRVYFYLHSLSQDSENRRISNVWEFLNNDFLEKMDIYSRCRLSGMEFTKSMIQMDPEFTNKRRFSQELEEIEEKEEDMDFGKRAELQAITTYGTKRYPHPHKPPLAGKVVRKRYCEHGFMETPQFWDDLIEVGSKIGRTPVGEREDKIVAYLQEVNEKLPANVYIPFFKDEIRLFTILCVWKGRLFATKERAPYSIWVEIYRETEELNLSKVEEAEGESGQEVEVGGAGERRKRKKNFLEKIYDTISKPFSISGEKNTLNIKKYITEKLSIIDESLSSNSKTKKYKKSLSKSFRHQKYSFSDVYQDPDKNQSKSERLSASASSSINDEQEEPELVLDDFFGPNADNFIQKVRAESIYRQLRSWKLVHLMIKTGDDIKQEQFAMQLINRFQYIFNKEKLDCVVFPYEVISLGPDCGIIEMLNNVTTLNGLFEKLHARHLTLGQFFRKAFAIPDLARRNFMHSLAGYSVLCYFLQVKDRHNGNILINREGFIIHIDFGFFLSNAPGGRVELEKKVPFKFLSEYIEVLGGLNSEQFFEFRRLFYKGFSAVLKHKDSIITLVKMMFSCHGESMGCFKKGELAIEQLERRFSIQHGVQSFCYDLINSSLDNWRARWYDKFQYFLQKIYY